MQMNTPSWDGLPETLDAYEEEVELLLLGTPAENRKFLGPRLVSVLPRHSTQRKAAGRLSRVPDDTGGISCEEGADNIVKLFRKELGTRPLPLAAERILKYFKASSRLKGESMTHFGERERDIYEEALKAVQAIEPETKELVPDVVRGMLVWESSGLAGPEKATIAAALSGAWSRDKVINKLVATWADKDLRQRDGVRADNHRPHKGKSRGHGQHAAWNEDLEHEGYYEQNSFHDEYLDYEDIEYDIGNYYQEEAEQPWEAETDCGTDSMHGYAQTEDDQDESVALDFQIGETSAALANSARTFAEAKSLLSELKTARDYFPVVGIAAMPHNREDRDRPRFSPKGKGGGKTGKFGRPRLPRSPENNRAFARHALSGKGKGRPQMPPRSATPYRQPAEPAAKRQQRSPAPQQRPPPGKVRCLICNGPHRAIECPTRSQVGSHGNGAVAEEHGNCFAGFAMGIDVSTAFAVGNFFVAEDIYGYAIVDTGATKSMTSFKQMEWLQELLCGLYDEDVMGRAPANVRFHFAGGGEATQCAGMIGVPHDLGLEGDEGYIWFAAVPNANSPTLLGLDWLEAAGFNVNSIEGILENSAGGIQIPLHRLPTGHWGLPLVPE